MVKAYRNRFVCYLLAVLTMLAQATCFAQASEDRVAVIIGNSSYPKQAALKNPINDANAISKQLKQLGFETNLFLDVKSQDLNNIRQIIEKRVRRNTVLFFYYAGHGVQIDGRNYLIPIDTRTASSDLIAEDALYLGDILAAIEKKRPKLAAVILDACRDDPFKNDTKASNTSKGLARVDPPSSTVIFYATRPGGTAADGDGDNGLFTKSLLDEINKPDQPIEVIFRKTSTKVFDVSKSEQEPWVEGVIRQEFLISKIPVTPAIEQAQETKIASASEISTSSPLITQDEAKFILSALSTDEVSTRLRSLSKSLSQDTKTSFICDDKGCYDYGQWAKSLNTQENLDRLISQLKQLSNSKLPSVCVFSLAENKCIGPAPKLTIVYPLAPFQPSFYFKGYEFLESKITPSGSLIFDAKHVINRGDTRLDCLNSSGAMTFSNEKVNFDVSRDTCFNLLVPGSSKNTFQVLYVDFNKKEIVAKWEYNIFSFLTLGGASAVIKMTY
jgi:Caspase domain